MEILGVITMTQHFHIKSFEKRVPLPKSKVGKHKADPKESGNPMRGRSKPSSSNNSTSYCTSHQLSTDRTDSIPPPKVTQSLSINWPGLSWWVWRSCPKSHVCSESKTGAKFGFSLSQYAYFKSKIQSLWDMFQQNHKIQQQINKVIQIDM